MAVLLRCRARWGDRARKLFVLIFSRGGCAQSDEAGGEHHEHESGGYEEGVHV